MGEPDHKLGLILMGGAVLSKYLIQFSVDGWSCVPSLIFSWGQTMEPLVAQTVKSLLAVQETWVPSLCWEDSLEKEMATHSSILAWEIPWTEEPGGLQSMGHKESDTTERLHFHFQCPIFLPFHTVHGVLRARILKWFAIYFSSGPCFVKTLHHDLSILGGPTWHGS